MVYNAITERSQNIDSYNAWFYSNAKTVYDIDYHIDNQLVPLHDDIYIGRLEVGNEFYYLVNKQIGDESVLELIDTQDIMLHKDNKAWFGHEYLQYDERETKKHIKRIIAVPNIEIEKVNLSYSNTPT